jgi:OmpA-OmpF porin, OOP family
MHPLNLFSSHRPIRSLTNRCYAATASGAMLCTVLLAVAPTPASASNDTGLYAGLSGGITQYRLKEADFARNTFTTRDSDKRDGGGKFFVGYRLHENFALEGQYALLGKATIDVATPANVTSRLKYEASAASFSALGLLPLSKEFTAFAKLGGARVEAELEPSNAAFGGRVKGNTNSLLVGLGASYEVADGFDVRAEFENYSKAGKRDRQGRSSINQFSVGVALRF